MTSNTNTNKEEKFIKFIVNNNCDLEKQINIKDQIACFQFTKLRQDLDNLYTKNFKAHIKKYRFYNMIIYYALNVLNFERKKGNLVNFVYENVLNLEKYLGENKERSFYSLRVSSENKEKLEDILTETDFFRDNVIYNLLLFLAYKELAK